MEKKNESVMAQLFIALNESRKDDFIQLLSSPGVDVNENGQHGISLLYDACQRGQPEFVQILLNSKANVNIMTKHSRLTPIEIACEMHQAEIVHILLDAGADMSKATFNTQDGSLLHKACEEGHPDVLQALLKSKPNLNIQDEKGETPLHFASRGKNAEIVRILLDVGADPNIQSKEGWTPLHFASMKKNAEIVRILLDAGADLTIKTKINRWTPLQYACRDKCDSQVAKMLIDKGANINIREEGPQPWRWYERRLRDENHDTDAFHYSHDENCYEYLPFHCTPLDIAAFYGCPSCVKAILSAPGLDLSTCKSAAHIARDHEVSKMLKRNL